MRVDFIFRNYDYFRDFVKNLSSVTNKSQSFIITHFVKFYIEFLKEKNSNLIADRFVKFKAYCRKKYIIHLKFNKVFYEYIKRFAFKYDLSINDFILNSIFYVFSKTDYYCNDVGYSEFYDYLITYFSEKYENISVRNYNFSRFNLRRK